MAALTWSQVFIFYAQVDKAYLVANPSQPRINEWSLQLTRPSTETAYNEDWARFVRVLSVNERDVILCVTLSILR